MIGLIFIALAAICNSIMDTLVHHYDKSIFKGLKPQLWNPKVSWVRKYTKPPYTKENLRYKFPFAWVSNFLDAWHVFKVLMLICIYTSCISIAIGYSEDINIMKITLVPGLNIWWDILIYKVSWYIAWNAVFELFYQKIWIKS